MTEQDDALAAAGAAIGGELIETGGLLARALVAAICAPSISYGTALVMGPDGNGMNIPVPQPGPSPLQNIATALWAARKDEIVTAVIDRLDVAAVAETVCQRMVDELTRTRTRDRYWHQSQLHPDAAEVQKLVRDQLATTLSSRAMQAYDDEQTEMREALAEKRAREAAAS